MYFCVRIRHLNFIDMSLIRLHFRFVGAIFRSSSWTTNTNKVTEHHRKQKKEAKKNPTTGRKIKDPGIPNSLPFKEEVTSCPQQPSSRLCTEWIRRDGF